MRMYVYTKSIKNSVKYSKAVLNWYALIDLKIKQPNWSFCERILYYN